MTALYLGAVGLGGVLLAATFFLGDGDGDGEGGVGGFALAVGGAVGSTRFWTFGSLSFGLTGLLSTCLGFAPGHAFAFAGVVGVGLGYGLFRAFRALAREEVSGETTVRDYVGSEARVLLPVGPDRPGKIGVERMSGRFEVGATSGDGRTHGVGDLVSVVDATADGRAIVVSTGAP